MANLNVCYKGGNADGEAGYWLGFHYDPDTVEAIKKAIPHTDRRWNEDKKLWWVSEEYDAKLCELFPNFYALAHQQGSLF